MSGTKVNQLQLLQQNLESIAMQKQQIQAELTEIDSALEELKSTTNSFRVIGKIMVATPKEKLVKDLTERKEVVALRLNNFTKQENKVKENFALAQKDALEEISKEQKNE
jgi:prefoldin beta subunit